MFEEYIPKITAYIETNNSFNLPEWFLRGLYYDLEPRLQLTWTFQSFKEEIERMIDEIEL